MKNKANEKDEIAGFIKEFVKDIMAKVQSLHAEQIEKFKSLDNNNNDDFFWRRKDMKCV